MPESHSTPTRRILLLIGAVAMPVTTLLPAAVAQVALPAPGGPIPIGIIGSGRIGGTLGRLWVKAGHPVLFSSRHPDMLKPLAAELGPLAHAGTPAEAAAFGQAVLIAVPYGALPQIGRELAPALAGKVVLDANNAVPARDGAIAQTAKERGIGILSAELLPGARVVRAFNSLGSGVLARNAGRPDPKLAIPIAGDDGKAVAVAAVLVQDAGFDPVVVGKLDSASEFAQGARGYGQQVTAPELRKILGL